VYSYEGSKSSCTAIMPDEPSVVVTGVVSQCCSVHCSSVACNLHNTTSTALSTHIHNSVQRVTSGIVVAQLRSLNTVGLKAAKFDRELWRTQLTPVLDAWEKLTASSSDINSSSSSSGKRGTSSSKENSGAAARRYCH
jgi:hypothetical protein